MNSLVAGVNRRMFEAISIQKDNLAKEGDPNNIIDCLEACGKYLVSINGLNPSLARKILLFMTGNLTDADLGSYFVRAGFRDSQQYREFKTAVDKLTPEQKKELSNVLGISVYFHIREDEAVAKVIAKLKQAKKNYRLLTGQYSVSSISNNSLEEVLPDRGHVISNSRIRWENQNDVFKEKIIAKSFYKKLADHINAHCTINKDAIIARIIDFNSLVDVAMRKQIRFKLALSDLNLIAKKIINDINDAAVGQELNVEQSSTMLIRATVFSNYHRHVGMEAKSLLKAVSFIPAVSLGAIFSPISIYYGIKNRRQDHRPRGADSRFDHDEEFEYFGGLGGCVLGGMNSFGLVALLPTVPSFFVIAGVLAASSIGGYLTGKGVAKLNTGDNIMKNTNTSIACLKDLNNNPAQLDRLRKDQKENWIKSLNQENLTKAKKEVFWKFNIKKQEEWLNEVNDNTIKFSELKEEIQENNKENQCPIFFDDFTPDMDVVVLEGSMGVLQLFTAKSIIEYVSTCLNPENLVNPVSKGPITFAKNVRKELDS